MREGDRDSAKATIGDKGRTGKKGLWRGVRMEDGRL